MKISIITVFPELYEQFLGTSLIARAKEKSLISFNVVRFSDMCEPKERIDEPVCGHGSGMIIKPEILEKSINLSESKFGPGYKIFFSPQGKQLSQRTFQKLSSAIAEKKELPSLRPNFLEPKKSINTDHLILICTRYEGIDERVISHYADAVISIGDYVLMGGDIPAQAFLEGFLRLIPGIVGKHESIEDESFSKNLLDYPEYGLPREWNGLKIPDVVFSGNHAEINSWRNKEACKKTLLERFDWFRATDKESSTKCSSLIPSHFVALMHTDVEVKGGGTGCTSVTSVDIHDIARSAVTYGIKNSFMVTPLVDQQAIMNDLLSFWKSDGGKAYNLTRHEAILRVKLADSLKQVIDVITKQEGKAPILVATSAKIHKHPNVIDYESQGLVWRHDRPVLFLFGTGQGLSQNLISQSEYLLLPVCGMTDYNHLSVRSAVGIILDRWLGLNERIL